MWKRVSSGRKAMALGFAALALTLGQEQLAAQTRTRSSLVTTSSPAPSPAPVPDEARAPRVDVDSYPFTPFLFDSVRETSDFRSADRRRYRSADRHDNARVAENIELFASGSGIPANPQKADYGMIVSAFKNGFGSLVPPRAGELNGLFVSVRQDGGDTNLLSANGALIDRGKGEPGYLSSFEGISTLYPPNSNVPTQAVNTQIGILNTRDRANDKDPPGIIGFHTLKSLGTAGGTAINVASTGGKTPANWTFGLVISREGKPQLVQASSDASLAIYPLGTSANPFKLLNNASGGDASSGLQVVAPDGRSVVTMTGAHDLRVSGSITSDKAWTTFVPTVSATSGSIVVASAAGRYSTVGRTTFIQIDIAIRDAADGSGAIAIADLPPGAAAKAGIPFVIPGRELNKARKMLIAEVAGRRITVTNYDNSFPGGDGYRLILTGSYESF